MRYSKCLTTKFTRFSTFVFCSLFVRDANFSRDSPRYSILHVQEWMRNIWNEMSLVNALYKFYLLSFLPQNPCLNAKKISSIVEPHYRYVCFLASVAICPSMKEDLIGKLSQVFCRQIRSFFSLLFMAPNIQTYEVFEAVPVLELLSLFKGFIEVGDDIFFDVTVW